MLRFSLWFTVLPLVWIIGCGQPSNPPTTATPTLGEAKPAAGSSEAPESKPSPEEQPVAETPSTTPTEPETPTVPASTVVEKQEASPEKQAVAAKPKSQAGPTQVMMNLNAVTENIVGAYILHPKRFLESPLLKSAQDAEAFTEQEFQQGLDKISQQMGIAPQEMEEISILFDQQYVMEMSKLFGMGVAPEQRMAPGPVGNAKNRMKMVGLGFHNYHDVFNLFPASDGSGDGVNRVGFSWRVQLAPFVDAAAVYNQVNFEEDWDSDANSQLHAQMPGSYVTDGVEDAGQTALHVITGEGTLFDGENGKKIGEITDGTSNSILAITAGTDTAAIWMQPGGLEFDPNDPKACLGKVEGEGMLTLLADGSVVSLSKDIDAEVFANLVTPSDGNNVDPRQHVLGADPQIAVIAPGGVANQAPFGMVGAKPEMSPLFVVKLSTNIDREKMLAQLPGTSESKKAGDREYFAAEGWAMAFPTEQTGVFGNEGSVERWLTALDQESHGALAEEFRAADQPFDALAAIDLASQKELILSLTRENPMLGMLNNLKTISLHANSAGKSGDPMVAVRGSTVSPESAQALAGVVNGMLLGTIKQQLAQLEQLHDLPEPQQELMALIKPSLDMLEMEAEENQLSLVLPTPERLDEIVHITAAQIKTERGRAVQFNKMNPLKQIGLAFHNYHDLFQAFPKAGGPAEESDNVKDGLSWRVHLLPFLDQAELYNQFHLDEPWDSEHNKTLIEQMPEVFKVDGVDEPGKTSIHVLIGEGAPFADNQAPGIRDITDGTSNTLLAVEAGADTAEIWTKPGGLEYDVNDPLAALGNIGETFLVLFADGSARDLPRDIDPDTLLHLFQHQDGNPVEIPAPAF